MKKNILIAVIVFTASLSFTQSAKYPNAQPGYEGIFVLLSGELNNSSFTIERSESKKDNWTSLGSTKTVYSSSEFTTNFEHYSNRFPDLLRPQNADLENIWSIIQRTKTLDSLFLYGNSPIVRLALGISFFDSTAEKNKSYKYRITQTDPITGRTITSIANDVTFPDRLKFGKPISSLVRSSSDKAFLQWKMLRNERLSSFLVFRQSNGKGEFQKVNVSKGFSIQRDSILLTIQDRNVDQNNFYEYFIIPTDLFGNRGEQSDEVFCGIYDFSLIVLPTDIKVESVDSLSALKLSWQIPLEQPVVSMQIFRSEYFDSTFMLIAEIPYSSIEYWDYNVKPMQKYFYYLQLIGLMGEISPKTARVFGFCQSSEIPIPPIQLKAEPLPNGVKLSWKNSEDFIEGFWIYRTDGIADSLRLISSLIKEEKPFTIFYDTTGLSGKLTYQYAVRSASVSHVLSDFSDTISVRANIKTLPPPPMELAAEIDESTAFLKWKDMTEIDSTIWGYLVFRRTEKSKEGFKPISDSTLTFYQNYFADKTIKPGNSYEYQVQVVDMFGGISDPSSASISYEQLKPALPEGLTAVSVKAGIELRWNESAQPDIKEYRVYRQIRNTEPELLEKIKHGKELKFIDKSTVKDELYFYFVTAVNTSDLESKPGQIVSIRP